MAYALTRGIKGTNLFRTVFFMPNLIGGIVLGYIWQLLLNGILMKFGVTLSFDADMVSGACSFDELAADWIYDDYLYCRSPERFTGSY